jgi:HlyD family secretion protein
MVNVETGIGDTMHMEVKSGIKAGDEVVSGPFSVITRTLKEDTKVRLEPPKKRTAEQK